jgi:hypothetical protein
LHRLLHSAFRIYIGYPTIAVKLPVDAAHAEVFDFEEFLDAVFRAQ